jgi:Na+/H+ antiporter
MHLGLLLGLGLLLAICLLIMVSQRLAVPYPIVLVLAGLGIGFIPGLPVARIDPEVIFLIFLPALLYEAAWFTSWKDFWKWRRVIGFLAFGLVFLTSGVVAWVSAALIPGFTLALGFLLGGIISPPDAVAASSVMRTMHLPRRLLAVLEGESLINDASSLIVLRFALGAVFSGTFVWQQAATSFFLVTGLGIGIGLAVGVVFYAIHRWLPTSPSIHTALTLATPYLMYAAAEAGHGSGVMAVVSGGLFMSYHSPALFSPANRRQGQSTWTTVGFVLNGAVFLLIGLQLPFISNALGNYSKPQAIGYGLLIAGLVIVTRLAFVLLASLFSTFMSSFIRVEDAAPGWRGPLVAGYAGMRGVVSLAAALSLPLLDGTGHPFPQRNLILFITFLVILVTLVGQGLTLPLLIRWVGVEDRWQQRPEHEQRLTARQQLTATALHELHVLHPQPAPPNGLLSILQNTLENDLHLAAHQLQEENNLVIADEVGEYHRVYTQLLHVQRHQLHHLRQQDEYDDEVIRQLETQLDVEAEKLALFVEDQHRAALTAR